MKRNVIKLHKGYAKIKKETVQERIRSEKDQELMNKLLSESLGLGVTIVLPIAGGAIIGVVLDKFFSTAPKLTLGLLFFGVFISFYKMFKLTQTGDSSK